MSVILFLTASKLSALLNHDLTALKKTAQIEVKTRFLKGIRYGQEFMGEKTCPKYTCR